MPDAGFFTSNGYFVKVPLGYAPSGELFLKTIDSPIIKTFSQTVGTVSVDEVKSIHWNFNTIGSITDVIQASSTNKLLCVLIGVLSGSGATHKLYASDTEDTADGNLLLQQYFPSSVVPTYPPFPIILDFDQFLTVDMDNTAPTNRNLTLTGWTVELPDDFELV